MAPTNRRVRELLIVSILFAMAASACGNGSLGQAFERSSCPDPVEGSADLVEAQAEAADIMPPHEVVRRGPDRATRSESAFACELVVLDPESLAERIDTHLIFRVIVEYYLSEERALNGYRSGSIPGAEDAPPEGFLDDDNPRRSDRSVLSSVHHMDCVVVRTSWTGPLADSEAPNPADRDRIIREAFSDVTQLCQSEQPEDG